MKTHKTLTRTTRFPSNQWYHWIISFDQAGSSLLAFLSSQLTSFPSKKYLKRVLEKNACYVNGSIERFASRKLQKEDQVYFTKQLFPKIEKQKPTILFEDDEIVVVDKPIGITSESLLEIQPGTHLVHRLDKPTSGVMVFAKTLNSQEQLIQQFKQKQVKKTYLALVHGCLQKKKGRIESYLVKKGHFEGQTFWGSHPSHGRLAITEFSVLEPHKEYSLLQIHPVTGKTHQIRVHMKELQHPILGDAQYAKDIAMLPSNALMLHSYQLSFLHPKTKKPVFLKAKIPSRFLSYSCKFFTQKQKNNSRNRSHEHKYREKIEKIF